MSWYTRMKKNKVLAKVIDKEKWVITISWFKSIQIETNLLIKDISFRITNKVLINKDVFIK